MSIAYGVLVGAVLDRKSDGGDLHFQIQVRASGTDYRVLVNVQSAQNPAGLLYLVDDAFDHPILSRLASLDDGFHGLPSIAGGVALDYIRSNLFERDQMRALPADAPEWGNDLSGKLGHFVSRALADPQARVYVFGERWGPELGRLDGVFGFQPGNGIHDIHMQQGNRGWFEGDDGVWQDGALLIHFPCQTQWVGFFLAFQSQVWHTDDLTGIAMGGVSPEPHRRVRIVAAQVNPIGPGLDVESVTLLNCSPQQIDLGGWRIADDLKSQFTIRDRILPAGAALQLPVQGPVLFGNRGGLITLLDVDGLKVDGVSYTAQDVTGGWTVAF